ncbi:MAG: hypothetical protein K8F91_08375 [Candidatus Obscuribacterales bacterium]|nr:hypothetical protein [Candidatus Obscuribacterales bacterium]
MRCPGCDLYHPSQYDKCVSCGMDLRDQPSSKENEAAGDSVLAEPAASSLEASKRRSKNLKLESRAGVPAMAGILTAIMILLVSAGATYYFLTQSTDEKRLISKGRDQLSKGQYAFAVETLNKAARTSPQDPRVYLLLARAYVGIDKVSEAWEAISKAQQLGEGVVSEPELASDLANYYRLRKKYDKAIDLLRPLAAKDIAGKKGELADLDGLWGDEALSTGDLDTALRCWEEVKELKAGSRMGETEARLATIYEKMANKFASEKKDEEALSYLSKLTHIAQNPKHYEFAAEIYQRSGKLDLAIDQLRKALELSNSPQLQTQLAALLARRGKELLDKGENDTGYAYLQQARSVDPTSVVPEVALKKIFVGLNPVSKMPMIKGEIWNPGDRPVGQLSLRAELYDSKSLATLWSKETRLIDEFVRPLGGHQSRDFEFVSDVRAKTDGSVEFKIFVDGSLYKAYAIDSKKQAAAIAESTDSDQSRLTAAPAPAPVSTTTSMPPLKLNTGTNNNTTTTTNVGSAPLPGTNSGAPLPGANTTTSRSPEERTLRDLDF